MGNLLRKAITIGIIAGMSVFLDGIITQILNINRSLTWVIFIAWTVFFGATTEERLKAIPCCVIGAGAAYAIIVLGTILSNILTLKILGIALGSMLAVILINFIVTYFEKLDRIKLDSLSGIFVGMALTFSGLGMDMEPSWKMLGLILIYTILGLCAGWCTLKFGIKNKNEEVKK